MKKIIAFVLSTLLVLSMVGCGSKTPSDVEEDSTPSAPDEASSEYAEFTGETITKIKEKGKLVVGTEAQYAPFEFMDMDGNYVGCDIWLAQQIANALGVKLEIVDMAFDGIIPAVKSGQVDLGIAAFTVDEERAKEIDFTEIYYHNEQMLVVQKENVDVYTSKEALVGKTLGAQRGTIQSKLIQSALPESKLFELDKYPALAMEVSNGNIDGLVVDESVGAGLISNNDKIAQANFVFDKEDADFGKAAVLQKGTEDLLALVNAVILKTQEDGSFNQVYDEAVTLSKTLGI